MARHKLADHWRKLEREQRGLRLLGGDVPLADDPWETALDWYVEVFGARQRGELIVNADGTVGHAEVGIGNAVLMFSEASQHGRDVRHSHPQP